MKQITKSALLILAGLVFFISADAQSITGRIWQLQNPEVFSTSVLVSFEGGSNIFTLVSGDLVNLTSDTYVGTYRLYDDVLEVRLGNESDRYKISWINQNRVVLSNSNQRLVYAEMNTSEDQFFSNYLAITGGYVPPVQPVYPVQSTYPVQSVPSNNGGTYGTTNNNTTCYTCYGSGSCKVCGGSGRYSMYGQSGPCSACSGTGKCWHCHGSRKQ